MNVVDLMRLQPASEHPHGLSDPDFDAIFTRDTPVLNELDRFHLVIDVIDRVPSLGGHAVVVRQEMVDARSRARRSTREFGADIPEVTGWEWSAAP